MKNASHIDEMNIETTVRNILKESILAKQNFLSDKGALENVVEAARAIIDCYRRGGKVIVFGNGGSAADSQHLAAELVVRFEKERKALACIALTTNTSILTAAANDYSFDAIFARQIEAMAEAKDAIVAISTSGSSENVIKAAKKAKEKKAKLIALTGKNGGKLAKIADIPIVVKADNTARIQEVHITIIHILCKLVEDALSRTS